ncbi:MAG: hypothetical protein LBK99_21195 [Opitutaceae bacterium]|jgi:hypothetical protein|nr:hypothetical protein [Opitutaceae bacterium]
MRLHSILSLATLAVWSSVSAVSGVSAASAVSAASWPPVPPVDFSKISVADFSDEDLNLVAPLAHFAQVANAVRETGPERGFIDIVVWRDAKDNRPYNARIMENVLSLAWFYTADRKWNPYRAHPAVRARLEAVLDFLARTQAPDGSFSEYKENEQSLAATGFMTKFLGETLELLAAAPGGSVPIDPAVLARAHATLRKALLRLLGPDDFYKQGAVVSNQYGNVWPGGQAWLHLHPDDAEIRALWEKRFRQSTADFQSGGGFFFESWGPDFGYTLGTHGSNTGGVWPYLRDTPLAAQLLGEEKRWFEFLSYNAVPQPGERWFAVNQAIETRQSHPMVYPFDTPMAEFIPEARALSRTREERAATDRQTRARLTRDWPGVAPLKEGEFWAYTPYVFQARRAVPVWRPTDAMREAARAQNPVLARGRFNHLRRNTSKTPGRGGAHFYYLRRPAWYATFATGNRSTRQQRYGLGLLWRPDTGVLLHNRSRIEGRAWGTHAPGAKLPFEYESFEAALTISGRPAPSPLPAAGDLPEGDLVLSYPLKNHGEKTVTFSDAGLDVRVNHRGAFEERFPLTLARNDTVAIAGNTIVVRRAGVAAPLLTIAFTGASGKPDVSEATASLPGHRLAVVNIPAGDRLDYTLRF